MIKLPIRVGSDLSERIEASYAEAIQRVGEEEIAYVRSKLPRVLAALFYLCNPYDIIPDRVRGTGFVDDAVVMNSCLRRVEEEAPDLYRQITAAARNLRY